MTTIKKRGRPRKNPVATETVKVQEVESTPPANTSTKKKIAAGVLFGAGLALINHLLKKA